MSALLADPFSALSARQIAALCDVAFGGVGRGFAPATLESLVRLELIESVQVVEHAPEFGGANFVWTAYTMPLPVHIAFCEWCSAQEEEATP